MAQLHIVLLECLQLLMDPGLIFPLNQVLVFVFNHCSSHVVVELLFLKVEVLFGLRKLSSQGVDHNLFLLHDREERGLLTHGTLHFLSFSFALELDFAEIIFEAFFLELEFIVFSLKDSPVISFLFDVFSILNEKLILVDFKLISLLSKIERFLLRFAKSSL